MTISCRRWLKTAISGGNLWSTDPQPKDDGDDDDDDDKRITRQCNHAQFTLINLRTN